MKIGLMGVVGHFDSPDFHTYPRDATVICRTSRGLEAGVVICALDDNGDGKFPIAGQLLRRVGSEDQRILDRLDRHRDKAFRACEKLVAEQGLPGLLVDVEHLFDGKSVYFYFLGDVDPRLESLTHELAALYEQKVRFKKFAETLANGCGPDCGTDNSGCSAGGCGSCKAASSCGLIT